MAGSGVAFTRSLAGPFIRGQPLGTHGHPEVVAKKSRLAARGDFFAEGSIGRFGVIRPIAVLTGRLGEILEASCASNLRSDVSLTDPLQQELSCASAICSL
jgi:hypothetical protein